MKSIATFFKSIFESSDPDTRALQVAHRNFKYVPDVGDERRHFTNIDRPFYGDCEDFAFTLQKQIGGTVRYVMLDTGQAHAVLCKGGKVYCNLHRWPTSQENYRGEFRQELSYKGELIDNG